MNKKAQTLGLTIISSVFFFLIGMTVINFLMPEITDFRANMNCASVNDISDGNKLVCLIGDTVVIYWIILILSITLGAITSRLLL